MASLSLKNIYKVYPNGFNAVKDFNLEIEDKEFIIFVGPSGCGKSTTLRMIAGLEDISSGELWIGDKLVNDVEPKDRDIAMVFQNYALYPHMSVYDNMAFGLKLRKVPKEKIDKQVHEAAKILDIEHLLDRKPKALSGGQRQRIGIAKALSLKPEFIVCDEPVSALDVSIQAQILNLIRELQNELGLTSLFVGHGLGAVRYVSDRIAVMYLGKIVEIADAGEVFMHPVHPYTKALTQAAPVADPGRREEKSAVLTGEVASAVHPPKGCRFHPRCPYAREDCSVSEPMLLPMAEKPDHLVACPYYEGTETA